MKLKLILMISLIGLLILTTACQPRIEKFNIDANSCEANGGNCVQLDECTGELTMIRRDYMCNEQDTVCCIQI
jgi:hypothetical protein